MATITSSISTDVFAQMQSFSYAYGNVDIGAQVTAYSDALSLGSLQEVSLSPTSYVVNVFDTMMQQQGSVTYTGTGFSTAGWDGNPATLTNGVLGAGSVLTNIRMTNMQGADMLVYTGTMSGDTITGTLAVTELQIGSAALGGMVLLKGNLSVNFADPNATLSGSITEMTLLARDGSQAYQMTVTGNLTPSATFTQDVMGGFVNVTNSIGGVVNTLTATKINYTDTTGSIVAGQQVGFSATNLGLAAADLEIIISGNNALNLVSSDANGAIGNATSTPANLSADGRYVVFESDATNLVAGDTNGLSDTFLKDTQTGAVTRVSTATDGAQATGASFGAGGGAGVSADGRYVVFESDAANLVAGDTNGVRDIFVKDTVTGAVGRMSTDVNGSEATGGLIGSYSFDVSADGRYVVFGSDAANLVANDTNNTVDLFLKDIHTGAITRVNTAANGAQVSHTVGADNNLGGIVTADGRYVVFESDANNLVAGDTNGVTDIFKKDLLTGAITRVNTNAAGAAATGDINYADDYVNGILANETAGISADGRYVAFNSLANNLVAGDTNGVIDAFVKDTLTGAITRVNTDASGAQANGLGRAPRHNLSADGRYVVFQSTATNLVAGDTNGVQDVFVKDIQTGAIARVNLDAAGGQAVGGGSSKERISADGSTITFSTNATNLVAGHVAGVQDVVTVANPFMAGAGQLIFQGNDTLTFNSDLGVNISGFDGNDVMTTGAGIDELNGGLGDDTLNGGASNDTLNGGAGDDTYVFGRGYGADLIRDESGALDVIQIAANVLPAEVTYARGSADLLISINGTGDSLTVRDFFLLDPSTGIGRPNAVEEIHFAADNSVVTRAQIDALLPLNNVMGTAGNDAALVGTTGNDMLYGMAGNDTLTGGLGNDVLVGGAGNNTFVFNLGDGRDKILSSGVTPGAMNTLQLGAGTTAMNVSFKRDWAILNDLQINTSVGTDRIFIQDFFSTNQMQIQFGDGTFASPMSIYSGNYLQGGSGTDVLPNPMAWGSNMGNDVLDGAGGYDRLTGGQGNDTYMFGRGRGFDVIDNNDWTLGKFDMVRFEQGVLSSEVAARRINTSLLLSISGTTDNLLIRDYFLGDLVFDPNTGTQVPGRPNAVEEIRFADGVTWTLAQIDTLYGPNHVIDMTGQPVLNGTAGDDFLYGGGQSINGGAGNDQLTGYGNTTFDGGAGNDVMSDVGGGTNTYLFGRDSGRDEVRAWGDGFDTVQLGANIVAADISWHRGGFADLVLNINGTTDQLTIAGYFQQQSWFDPMQGNQVYRPDVVEEIRFADNTVWTPADFGPGVEGQYGTPMGDVLTGTSGSDYLAPGFGDDSISAGAGDDFIDGGRGIDMLMGGTGNDIYNWGLGQGQDTIWDESGSLDTVEFFGARMHSDTTPADVTLVRNYNDLVLGINGTPDTLTIRDYFMQGAMSSRPHAIEVVRFPDGTVWTMAQIDARLASNAINGTYGADTLTGTSSNDIINGLDGNDTLDGLAGNDTLDGGIGADTMAGGLGDDTYVVDNAGDVVTESANQGIDTVQSSISYTLGANLENLTLTGAGNINAVGNGLNNLLIGNAGNNTLNGGIGNDTMMGGLGNDSYTVNAVGDSVVENLNEGVDTVTSAVSYTLNANVENLTLSGAGITNGTGNELDNAITGNSAANTLTGGAGNDTLNGGLGADTMLGGLGDDTYVIDNAGDTVTESANQGIDTVKSTLTLTLGSNVENATLIGVAVINATGNSLNNTLIGNGAANLLNGLGGDDIMIGGTGADIYYVGTTGDLVVEDVDAGYDSVVSAITYTLGANVEKLTLSGTSAINGTGNELFNLLIGNGASNTLSGGAGSDTLNGGLGSDIMLGGLGNDTYVVDNAGDVVTEYLGEGVDTVNSSISYALNANVERLILTGTSAINGTGNELNNILTGNAAANILNGGLGNDTLKGGLGNDTYLLSRGSGTDVVVDTDAGVGNTDIAAFAGDINYDQLWFMHSGTSLYAKVIGTTDQLVIGGWYNGTANQVEQFQAGGKTLSNANVENLVQAMAAFSPPSAGQTTLPPAYQTALAPVIAANWA